METHVSQAATLRMQSDVSGEGAPIVVVGGGLTGWASWKPLLPRFTTMGRQVILLQPLNVQYGLESRPIPADYSVKTESGALRAALDSLDVKHPIDVMAWSYGALRRWTSPCITWSACEQWC